MEFNLAQVHEAIAAAIPDRECVAFREFCRDHLKVTERTGQRLVNAPDGLPVVKIGRRTLVHLPTADAWAKRRQVQRNPIRRGKAS